MFYEADINPDNRMGWIEVIAGPMFSGKTEELIRRLKRARLANQKVEIFKPEVDNRYTAGHIVSHDENSITSTPVQNSANILLLVGEARVVGIDEAQFFDQALTDVCNMLAEKGIRVIVAGLDMDFRGRPFGPMPELMSTAEYVTKLSAICMRCGNTAYYSHRIVESDLQVLVGEEESYEPLCRKCFAETKK